MAKYAAESSLQIHLTERWPEGNRVRWSRRAGGRVGDGACARRAVDDALATARVKAIVTAAGNDAGDSVRIAPGNCRGVLAVTAIDRTGRRAPYASAGTNVAIAAPGGAFAANATSGDDGILSLFNSGRTAPAADSFAFAVGTSEAAAHVSGAAALVLSIKRTLSAEDLRALLQRTARAFPNASRTPAACGAGIVDASAAVLAASVPAPTPAPAAAAAGAGDPAPAASAPVAAEVSPSGRLILRSRAAHGPRRTARA
jgi:serine protease